MNRDPDDSPIGVLTSGGLDSCILVGHLLATGHTVQPFYVQAGLVWEAAEFAAVGRFLAAIASPRLKPLVTLQLPVDDLYDGEHWSLSGRGVPDAKTPDEAVFLPGRNALLVLKAALWCQMRGVRRLALAPLGSSPFADASPAFFSSLQATLNCGGAPHLKIEHPFANSTKQDVMQLGTRLPLELTFSCIDPRGELHCGSCNKCAERQQAFRCVGRLDLTVYAERSFDELPRPMTA